MSQKIKYAYDKFAKRLRYATGGDPQKVRNCDVITRHLIFCTLGESDSDCCNCTQIVVFVQ